ncbi:threonine--tRNA ligase [Candidatus Falkowbacteria bacterium RIFCSPLOWO2_02_FULL_45_15]|uniref:Threonine--tRNA ligase n=2 Tax=Candidatus Falkowiibacteriota TaxID=1752728 RepID=A0A1F5RVR3_9BACT|nr:MAG: threonine--tRNA ligase [Candidatus Falkowbacteria bacterium RIFCSPHIGHO2_02_FULL_45_15]OGF18856.1 MAG: threonine--tRNA ligase [Candidatus Falkowbacteria bacterium RIFCSPLOWO2_02_FULL_45_15]
MPKKIIPQSLEAMRHSLAHVLMQALERLYDAIPGVGPAIDNGFYHDFDANHQAAEEDLPTIEAEMKKIIKAKLAITKKVMPIAAGIKLLRAKKYRYTLALAQDLKTAGATEISFYEQGDFINMCKGPHVSSTGDINAAAFKLTKVAGAYWKGDEKNKMIQRIYGVAFASKKALDEHLAMLAEAAKRDHRKIGQEQEIFYIDELVGKGLPIWLPNGTIIKDEIEKFAKEMENKYGYSRVSTPHVAKKELYLTSGHLPYYEYDMYPAMEMDDGTYYLKAMNCPHHHLIYKSKPRSYRDLPVRLAEYGTVYRNELSGTLAGLLRVRSLQMNDAHIYCRPDQLQQEIKSVLELILYYFKVFGFKKYRFRLSKWDPKRGDKYIAEPANWEFAERILREALRESKVEFTEAEDEAAFYGPKIDVQFTSIIGREETMSTIQLDFAAKSRFNLTYVDKKGKDNNEVFVIHRAPLSIHERLMAFLIEHYAGNWPVWLAPAQVKLVAVGEKHVSHCEQLAVELRTHNIRAEVDASDETVGNKIRKAVAEKVPYMLVIGDKETNSSQLSVRERGSKETRNIEKGKFIEEVLEKVRSKK